MPICPITPDTVLMPDTLLFPDGYWCPDVAGAARGGLPMLDVVDGEVVFEADSSVPMLSIGRRPS